MMRCTVRQFEVELREDTRDLLYDTVRPMLQEALGKDVTPDDVIHEVLLYCLYDDGQWPHPETSERVAQRRQKMAELPEALAREEVE